MFKMLKFRVWDLHLGLPCVLCFKELQGWHHVTGSLSLFLFLFLFIIHWNKCFCYYTESKVPKKGTVGNRYRISGTDTGSNVNGTQP